MRFLMTKTETILDVPFVLAGIAAWLFPVSAWSFVMLLALVVYFSVFLQWQMCGSPPFEAAVFLAFLWLLTGVAVAVMAWLAARPVPWAEFVVSTIVFPLGAAAFTLLGFLERRREGPERQ